MKNINDASHPQRRYNPGIIHGWILWYFRRVQRLQENRRPQNFSELALSKER